ncbi:hypothetical protein ACF0H5_007942 [Mactra antiquata]
MTVHSGIPKTPIIGKKTGGDLDFDLLVTRVENTIHEDRKHQRYGITPQELMMRSNPALYQVDNPANKDLANPREVYNILSHKTKSIEDLAAKFKQELAKSVQSTGQLPKLSRALSMNDIEHKLDKANRFGHKNESTGFTTNSHRKLLEFKRHNTSVNETRKTTENKSALNLPCIEEGAVRHEELNVKARQKTDLCQPTERTENCVVNKDAAIKRVEFSDTKYPKLIEDKEQTGGSDAKISKWFSEMPNEVFDKAQRALMEDSIKDRLQDYQKRRRKKHTEFPHPTFHVCLGPKVRKVPNTFLELRVDTFGRHIQNDKDKRDLDKDDKMAKYKLQQKSMHHLKMRGSADVDQHEKMQREEIFPKLVIQNRSYTATTGTKARKQDIESTPVLVPKRESTFPDSGYKTVYINDAITGDFVQNVKHRHGLNNYEEYTERLAMMKEMSLEISNMEAGRDHPHGEDIDKDGSKAAIVNITLKQDRPTPRNPHHLEKSLSDATLDDKLPKLEKDDTKIDDIVENEEEEKEAEAEEDVKPKLITKIPTAQSVRTSDTRSSNSSMSNKEALKKFNRLEVFGESQSQGNYTTTRDHFPKGKFQTTDELVPIPPPAKPETKPQKHAMLHDPVTPYPEIKRPDPEFVFRFEPGEVFIQRKQQQHTYTNTRCSERARIIYGKTLHGASDKNSNDKSSRTSKKKDAKSAITKSSFMDGFKSDFSRYESRAQNENLDAISPQLDGNIRNKSLVVTSNSMEIDNRNRLKLTRDVATETDLLGSIKDSHSQRSSDKSVTIIYNPDVVLERGESGLSDFIIENNDGESLESDDDTLREDDVQSTVSV